MGDSFVPTGGAVLRAASGSNLTTIKAGASSGQTIVVGPGTYAGINLAKAGVNWHFEPGAVLHFTGTGTNLWDDGGAAMTARISGYLRVTNAFAALVGIPTAFKTGHASTAVIAEVDEIDFTVSGGDTNIGNGTAGSLALRARRLVSETTAFTVAGASQQVIAEAIISNNGGIAVNEGAGTQDIQARTASAGTLACFVDHASAIQRLRFGYLASADTAFYANNGTQDATCDVLEAAAAFTSNAGGGTQSITLGRATSLANNCFNHDGGNTHITANYVVCDQLWNGGAIGGGFHLHVNEAVASINGAAIDAHEAGPVYFKGRLRSSHASGWSILAGTNTVRVSNAVLLAGASATNSVTGGTLNVVISDTTTNKALAGTITNLITSGLTVDADLA